MPCFEKCQQPFKEVPHYHKEFFLFVPLIHGVNEVKTHIDPKEIDATQTIKKETYVLQVKIAPIQLDLKGVLGKYKVQHQTTKNKCIQV